MAAMVLWPRLRLLSPPHSEPRTTALLCLRDCPLLAAQLSALVAEEYSAEERAGIALLGAQELATRLDALV